MSRVELEPKDPKHEVVVGLDHMLGTFFITVTQIQDEDDQRDLDPLEFRARWQRSEVIERIDRYAADTPRTNKIKKAIFLDLDPGTLVEWAYHDL